MIVVDEADMQLAGASSDDVIDGILRPTRAGGPMRNRPQHVLVGATLPDSGTRSVRRTVEHLYKYVQGVGCGREARGEWGEGRTGQQEEEDGERSAGMASLWLLRGRTG
jgi:hypothetical protein